MGTSKRPAGNFSRNHLWSPGNKNSKTISCKIEHLVNPFVSFRLLVNSITAKSEQYSLVYKARITVFRSHLKSQVSTVNPSFKHQSHLVVLGRASKVSSFHIRSLGSTKLSMSMAYSGAAMGALPASGSASSSTTKQVKLDKESELRIEVGNDAPLRLRLLNGNAEIFGTELPPEIWLTFPPRLKFAVSFDYELSFSFDSSGKENAQYLIGGNDMFVYPFFFYTVCC